MTHTTPASSYRYLIKSTFEVPLRFDAETWRKALCMALQVLERVETAARLELQWTKDGSITVTDPVTGEQLFISGGDLGYAAVSRAA